MSMNSDGNEHLKTICTIITYVFGIGLLIFFIAFVAFIVVELHQFNPHPPQVHNLSCSRFGDGSQEGQDLLDEYLSNRSTIGTTESNLTKCIVIKKRRNFPVAFANNKHPHPILFVRLVSKDYDFVEQVLSMLYSTQQFHCFPIDSRSSEDFEAKIRFLGMCMLTVIVPPGKFDGTKPKEVFAAHRACYDALPMYEWKHMAVLQESDVPVQSIRTIGQNIARLGQSSSIGSKIISKKLTAAFKQLEKNTTEPFTEHLKKVVKKWWLTRTKPMIISRFFYGDFYKFLDQQMTGSDFKAPASLSRGVTNSSCLTDQYDDFGNCLFGMEDYPMARKSKELFVRVDPSFDFGVVDCLSELVYHRTFD